MKLLLSVSSVVLIPVQLLFAQTGPSLSSGQSNKLDSIATQDVPPNAPGIATAIIQHGEVVYKKCAGIADFGDSSMISEDTRFNIASNGKQFTALAVLTLIDAGKLKLTDDIRRFFPVLYSKQKTKITIRNLLEHSSGIRDVYDLWSLQGYTWWNQSFSNKDAFDLILKQEEVNFKTGSKFLYSNSNYILLAMIIEKVTGKSFVQYTNSMFKELGMNATSFEDDYSKIRGPIARAYFNFQTWTTYNWIWNVCGDGNLFSTLKDQVQWEKIIQGKVVTSIRTAVIKKSQELIQQSAIKNYGYGLEFGNYKGMAYTFHEGATGAWKATVIRFPGKNVSMITLTNTGKSIPSMQTRQMADLFFKLKNEEQYLITKPATIGRYVSETDVAGIYLTNNDFAFQFELHHGRFFLKRNGRNDVELEREAANIFHQKNDPAFKQEFITNAKGEMEVTAYYTTHSPYTLTRANSNWDNFNYSSLNGKYRNSETNTLIEIEFRTGKDYLLTTAAKDSMNAVLISPSKLLANNYSINLVKAKTGDFILLLNGDRIRRVKFVKLK